VLELLSDFVAELRTAGLPVSMGEHVDAARSLEVIDLGDKELLRVALSSSMVKHGEHLETFERTFKLFFANRDIPDDVRGERSPKAESPPPDASGPGSPGDHPSAPEVAEQVYDALKSQDHNALRASAMSAVQRFAGIEAGRPVGSAYYLYRTMRHLDLESVQQRLSVDLAPPQASTLDQRIANDQATERIEAFTDLLEAEIMERLLADRGVEVMAKAARRPLPEDVDVMQANREDLAHLEKALVPLSKKLAARLAQRRRRRRRGPVDIRRTIRESLSTGGVPIDIRFRPPHPSKPEIVVLADMSGSVAAFARFTLLLVHALNDEFSRVRSFVFVDGIDEVTHFFDECDDPTEAADRIAAEANMVAADGHSDYGRVFTSFVERYANSLSSRSTLLVLGDARSNYHVAHAETFEYISRKVKRVYWLNPEPEAYWRSGDSVIAAYAPFCDAVLECRTLRQLETFVMELP
jgi:hypothetical protein